MEDLGRTYHEAEEGTHFCKVLNAKHPIKYNWKCLIPGCPMSGKVFTRKEYINEHWRDTRQHGPEWQVQATKPQKPGRKGREGQKSRESSTEERAHLFKATKGLFPRRWQEYKSKELERIKKYAVNEFLARHLNYLRDGLPIPPGPLPDLLLAVECLNLPYIDSWESFKHPQFKVWLKDHLHEVVIGCHRDVFGACIATGIAELNLLLASDVHDQGDRAKKEAANKVKALHAVAACIEEQDSGVVQHLSNHTCAFMDKAQRHYQYICFESNPVQEVDEAVQMRLFDWKGSEAGRQAKRKNGVDGLAHRKRRLQNLGFEEDEAVAKAEGRFSDAEKDDSDEEEKWQPWYHSFDTITEVSSFVVDHPKSKAQILLEWVKKYKSVGARVNVSSARNLEALVEPGITCGDPELTTVLLETDDSTVGISSQPVEAMEVAAENPAHHAGARSFLTPTTRELPNVSLAERRMEVQKNIVPTKLRSEFAIHADKDVNAPANGL
ncbi:unnamed protein product [Calypogeia fissa]